MRYPRRKREPLAALKRMMEIAPEAAFDPDEPDLQLLLRTNRTEKCKTEKWHFLFFRLTSFCLLAETMITAFCENKAI